MSQFMMILMIKMITTIMRMATMTIVLYSGEDNLSVEVSPVLAPGSWGEYECKASNRLGHASASTEITGDHHDQDDEDDDHDGENDDKGC